MNKNFKQVVKSKLKECVVVLAGISFTLFGSASSEAANPVYETSDQVQVEVVEEHIVSDDNPDMRITLASNKETETDKMTAAFERFQVRFQEKSPELQKMFYEIADEFKSIKFDKVSVDGNPKDGKINVAFRFSDGMILSINKKLNLHADNLVGFNIIHTRELIVSDVMPLSQLKEYISNVQKRLV